MATYIKGVTDDVQTFAPTPVDYSFLGTALSSLQKRYERGVDQWKSMYSSLINRELSSSDNEQFRADFLKKADGYLKQVAYLDLANAANMQQALSLFEPLTNDKEYLTDLYKTSAQNSQIAKSRSMMNSTNKDERATWSPIMDDYLNIGRERLRKTKRGDGSIEAAAVHNWMPWEDRIEYASKMAKEQGLEFSRTTSENKYLVTRVNGLNKEVLGTFNQWYKNTVGTKFDRQDSIEAMVVADKQIKSLMAQDPTLTEQAAIGKLSNEFADAYVKDYNDDITDLEQNISLIDNEMRAYRKKYPKGLDPRLMEHVDVLREQKERFTDELTKLRNGKTSDQDLKNKAIQNFSSNPGQMFYSQVRNQYANAFAMKWAANSKVTLAGDPVALQEDQQAHSWAMKQAEFAHAEKMQDRKEEFEIRKLELEGKVAGSVQGVEKGPLIDAGKRSLQSAYSQEIAGNFDKSLQAYNDPTILAIGANLQVQRQANGAAVISGANNINFDLQKVSMALTAKANNAQLTQEQAVHLSRYLKAVGSNLNPLKASWQDISGTISSAVGKNAKNDKNFGTYALDKLRESNVARENYISMWGETNKHLTGIANSAVPVPIGNVDIRQFVVRGAGNAYAIDYAKLEGANINQDVKDAIYRRLIPTSQVENYDNLTATKYSSIMLNSSKPEDFDYSLFSKIIQASDYIGVIDRKTGETELQNFKDLAVGGQNLSEFMGSQGTMIYRKKEGGTDYIVARIPLLVKTGEGGNAKKMINALGMNPSKAVAGQDVNYLEFKMPFEKVISEGVIPRQQTIELSSGKVTVVKNEFRDRLISLMQEEDISPRRSWVSKVTQNSTGEVNFPQSLTMTIPGGKLSAGADGRLYATIMYENQPPKVIDVTANTATGSSAGVTVADLRNPTTGAYADNKVNKFLYTLGVSYDNENTSNSYNRITNNGVAASTNPNYIPWSDPRVNF
jgi:hypothetical protein